MSDIPSDTLSMRLAGRKRVNVDARVAGARANLAGLTRALGSLVGRADVLDGGGTSVRDSGDITVVLVDTGEFLAVVGLDVGNGDRALRLGIAVTAGAEELAEVGDDEAIDADLTFGVVLDNLVLGTLGTTADDLVRAATLLEGERVCDTSQLSSE